MPEGMAYAALQFGFTEYQKGGLTAKWPDGPVGISIAPESLPEKVRLGLGWHESTKRIFTYRSVENFDLQKRGMTGTDQLTKEPRKVDPNSVEARDTPADGGIEAVNIKLDCKVKWNGPLVQALFTIPADGERARLGAEVTIEIRKPTSEVQQVPSPKEWAKIGLSTFAVIEIPISVFVDEPWPNDNTKVTFDLVLSGMFGFGTSTSGEYIKGGAPVVHRD